MNEKDIYKLISQKFKDYPDKYDPDFLFERFQTKSSDEIRPSYQKGRISKEVDLGHYQQLLEEDNNE